MGAAARERGAARAGWHKRVGLSSHHARLTLNVEASDWVQRLLERSGAPTSPGGGEVLAHVEPSASWPPGLPPDEVE
jgi:hypothetical protein